MTTQSTYASLMKRLQDQMLVRFTPSIYRAIKAQNSQFLATLKTYGLEAAKRQLSREIMNPYVAKPIQDLHKAAGLFMARRVRQQLGQKTGQKKALVVPQNDHHGKSIDNQYGEGFITMGSRLEGTDMITMATKAGFGFNERMVREIQEYFRIFLLEKAVLPITKTTIERINTVLDKAIEEGWGVDRIVQELEGTGFRDMTRRRAEMIVRTEVVRASNFGGMAAAFDSDYEMTKTWVEVKDNRTRFSHRHGSGVGGQVRDLLVPYSNGGQFPGDPELPGKEVCNCRCVQTYRLKRDGRGRPILKRPMLVGAPAYESLANVLAASVGFSLGNILGNLIRE